MFITHRNFNFGRTTVLSRRSVLKAALRVQGLGENNMAMISVVITQRLPMTFHS